MVGGHGDARSSVRGASVGTSRARGSTMRDGEAHVPQSSKKWHHPCTGRDRKVDFRNGFKKSTAINTL